VVFGPRILPLRRRVGYWDLSFRIDGELGDRARRALAAGICLAIPKDLNRKTRRGGWWRSIQTDRAKPIGGVAPLGIWAEEENMSVECVGGARHEVFWTGWFVGRRRDPGSGRSGSDWRFDATLSHADAGWEDYADGWPVPTEDGTVLGKRVLYRPHVEEQPFTRSLSGVAIPDGVTTVSIEARTDVDGWSGTYTPVTLP